MAGLFKRILGIVGNVLQIGGPSGPQLSNNSGVIENRNASGSAFNIMRGADPASSNDFVTLAYGNANYGSGSPTVVVELDFGSGLVKAGVFTVIDAGIGPSSNVFMMQSGLAPSGKSADENEFDAFLCRCTPGSGKFTAYVQSLNGPVTGKFKFEYFVK